MEDAEGCQHRSEKLKVAFLGLSFDLVGLLIQYGLQVWAFKDLDLIPAKRLAS